MDIRVGRGGFSLLGGDGGYQEAGRWMNEGDSFGDSLAARVVDATLQVGAWAVAAASGHAELGLGVPGVGGRGQNVLGRQCSG
jgi:hypothetical protein